jgi:hypothetical protein
VEPGDAAAWRAALAAEVRRGRARDAVLASDDIDTHAGRLAEVYASLLSRRDDPRAAL